MLSFIKLVMILMITALCIQSSAAAIVSSAEEEVNFDPHIYTVQSIGPDQDPDEFVVNDKIYDPKTYCDIAVGDQIKFLMNTPDDCVDTKIYNLRTKISCDVWCDFS